MTQNEAAPAGARNGTDAGTDEPSRKGDEDGSEDWPPCCGCRYRSERIVPAADEVLPAVVRFRAGAGGCAFNQNRDGWHYRCWECMAGMGGPSEWHPKAALIRAAWEAGG